MGSNNNKTKINITGFSGIYSTKGITSSTQLQKGDVITHRGFIFRINFCKQVEDEVYYSSVSFLTAAELEGFLIEREEIEDYETCALIKKNLGPKLGIEDILMFD